MLVPLCEFTCTEENLREAEDFIRKCVFLILPKEIVEDHKNFDDCLRSKHRVRHRCRTETELEKLVEQLSASVPRPRSVREPDLPPLELATPFSAQRQPPLQSQQPEAQLKETPPPPVVSQTSRASLHQTTQASLTSLLSPPITHHNVQVLPPDSVIFPSMKCRSNASLFSYS